MCRRTRPRECDRHVGDQHVTKNDLRRGGALVCQVDECVELGLDARSIVLPDRFAEDRSEDSRGEQPDLEIIEIPLIDDSISGQERRIRIGTRY
jgi:hypothetical protein